jgi:spore germination protein GerM
VTRRAGPSIAGLACVVLLLAATGCSDERPAAPEAPAPAPAAAQPTPGEPSPDVARDGDESRPLQRIVVEIYFPSAEALGLVGEEREIFQTPAPGDRAKQVIADLLSGPANGLALRALPQGTQLRQVYVLADGTAWVDFSADLREGVGGGSAEELITVYSIVNSVALNVTEIQRVGILIEGRPVETLNGHVDLRRPLAPDLSLILGRDEFV